MWRTGFRIMLYDGILYNVLYHLTLKWKDLHVPLVHVGGILMKI